MANQPIIVATVKITATDINGNSVAKQFNAVTAMNFDYSKGMLNVIDATGQFYFSLGAISTLTYTIVTGNLGSHKVVMS
jgi:hypothetical protein